MQLLCPRYWIWKCQGSVSQLTMLFLHPGSEDGILNDGQKSKVGKADQASVAAPGEKYHVVASVDGGLYTEWQVRICYYHYKKMRREYPDSPMGGFTRLLHRQAPLSGNSEHLFEAHAQVSLSKHLHLQFFVIWPLMIL